MELYLNWERTIKHTIPQLNGERCNKVLIEKLPLSFLSSKSHKLSTHWSIAPVAQLFSSSVLLV